MKILIIGGKGYIGTALLDFLKTMDNNVITIVDSENYSMNVQEYADIEYINAKYQDLPETFYHQFDSIILLAGQSSVSNSTNGLNVVDNNVRNFAWLLQAVKHETKFIYASSSSVYGKTDSKEVDETYSKTSGYIPYNYYDWSKQTIDQLAELSDKEYYGLRFGTVNGFSRNMRNDIMINSMCYNAKVNEKLCVFNADVNRPILGMYDLCHAIWTILLYGKKEYSGVYNLHSFNANVSEIAETVSKLCKIPCTYIQQQDNNNILNFKLQTNAYDFKISSNKFSETFNQNFGFEFKDTIDSIVQLLLENWHNVENFQNRMKDNFIPYKMISECKACGYTTKSLLDLKKQPLANNYQKDNKYNEEVFPLHLHVCTNCYHTQLNCVVSPEKLFRTYLYVSGTSKTLNDFFDYFAEKTLKTADIGKQLKILEIACNDGSQLDAFKRYRENVITVGVDPAQNIYNDISSKKCHDIYCEFFSQHTVDKLKDKYGIFDIIVAQNVLAHIDYPRDFLHYVSQLMGNETELYIQTSQKNMILENQFDTVYHEHQSFFNTNSMKMLCETNNLYLNNIEEHSIHGVSYIFKICKTAALQSNVEEILEYERSKGLYSLDTYKTYKINCLLYKNEFSKRLLEYKLNNRRIIAFGCTAKSMTVFNFCNLTSEYIDYMIDENPWKHNKYTPGSRIPIRGIEALQEIYKNTVIIVTAWNFYDEIKSKIEKKKKEYDIVHDILLLNMNSLLEEII
jgi:nucleoside-diphosphate-sugar epimerase/2-polyprenyl-3-methyl-5-hydroxy-6-metoxy-1,4-benzoquinol methylase